MIPVVPPVVSVPMAPTPPAKDERKIVVIPVAIAPRPANISCHVKPSPVAPAAGPVAVIATTPVVSRPHVLTPAIIVTTEITILNFTIIEIAIASVATHEIAHAVVELATAVRVDRSASQITLLTSLLDVTPKLFATASFTIDVAPIEVARLLIAAVLWELQKVTDSLLGRTVGLISVLS
jgi:hypothetical protein